MIPTRLRQIFAKERRPLLEGHVVLAFALIPVPWFRTGVADLLVIALLFPWPHVATLALAFCFWLSVFSLPLIPLFLAWSLPGAGRPGLPKRSIGALCLLIAYHPYRFLLEGTLYGAQTQASVAEWHEQFPIIWVFKHWIHQRSWDSWFGRSFVAKRHGRRRRPGSIGSCSFVLSGQWGLTMILALVGP